MPPHPHTRRGFGRLAAALLAPAPSPAAAFRFRYVISTSMYGQADLAAVLPEARRAGILDLDIWPRPQGNQRAQIDEIGLERFSALLRRYRLRVGVLSRYDLGPFQLAEEIRMARSLGVPTIVTGSQGPRDAAGGALKSAVRDFVERMKPQAAEAVQCGVTLAIENHGNALINLPDSLRWFAEFAPPGLGLALAPYHLEQNPAQLAALIAELGNRIAFFYAWQRGQGLHAGISPEDALQQLPGRGPMGFAAPVLALKTAGYRGWVSPFMHSVRNGEPVRPTPSGVTAEIIRARDYWDSLLRKS